MEVKPYELHISGPFTPNDYPVHPIEYFTQDSVKNAPSNGRLAECTFSETFTDANGTGTSGGTAKVSYTKGKVHRRRARPDARDSTRRRVRTRHEGPGRTDGVAQRPQERVPIAVPGSNRPFELDKADPIVSGAISTDRIT